MMAYQSMLVADRIAGLLQREGAEHVVGFPENRLINSAAALGMRPIITRTERVAVNIADGFARATNGERLLPCVTQYGPGTEAAFGAVAQAHGDRSPILLVPTEYAVEEQDAGPSFRSEQAYRPITRFAATVNSAAAGPQTFRRALNAVLGVRDGPALVAVANDVMNGDPGDADWDVRSARPRLTQALPDDVSEAARRLAAARHPVILAGQGVLYAGATAELVELAELTGVPVATTLNGKSAFPENHPLSLGTAARTRPAMVDEHYAARRPDPRRRHELHPVALHHAASRLGGARPDRERPARPRHGLRHRVRLRRRRPPRHAPAPGRAARRGLPAAAVTGCRARRLAGRLRRAVDAEPDVRRGTAQPLPARVGADAGRRPQPHRLHARRRPPPRPDRALLRDDRAARLPGLGQVDPARHRASA